MKQLYILFYLQSDAIDLLVLALQLRIHVHSHVPQVVDDAAHLGTERWPRSKILNLYIVQVPAVRFYVQS